MNILVTGGAGFIGSNFLNLMVPRHPEHHFINVDKLTYAANLREPCQRRRSVTNYSLERVDIADRERCSRSSSASSRQVVVHFAAESHVDRSILGARVVHRDQHQRHVLPAGSVPRHCRRAKASCFTTSARMRCTARSGRRATSSKRRRTTHRAPTPRPKRRAITWCARTTARTACRSRSPTARTTTGRTSSRRS